MKLSIAMLRITTLSPGRVSSCNISAGILNKRMECFTGLCFIRIISQNLVQASVSFDIIEF